MQFLLEHVVVWLAEKGRRDTEHLVEMVFSSLYCCSWQENTRILNHITTVTWDADVVTYELLIHASYMQRDDSFVVESTLIVLLFLCWHSLCFLDGFTLGNYPANYTEGMCHSVCTGFYQSVTIHHIHTVINVYSAIRPVRHVQILRLLRSVVIGWKVQFWASNSWDWLRSCARWDATLPVVPLLQATTVGRSSAWSSLSTTTMVISNTHTHTFHLFFQ